jgi:hypothetical protein
MAIQRFAGKLATPAEFRRRMFKAGSFGFGLIAVSLVAGVAGYAMTEHLGTLDAFLNAAMILSGMGPLNIPGTVAGKVFAGCYAIYCGFAVLGIAAIMFAPLVHHLFHRLHIEDLGDDAKS